jgi:hypothetical protein
MSSTSALESPSVALAEKLLTLVKSVASSSETFKTWDEKIQIQNICDRLLAQIMGPLEFTALLAGTSQESQALYFVNELGVADMIGSGELSLSELSTRAGVPARFLGVAMNCLLGRGYFEEVGGFDSRVYKNNELSSVLQANSPVSLKSAIGFVGDDAFRATSFLLDAARNKEGLSGLKLAHGFKGSVFDWLASPEHPWRGERMGQAMQQLHRVANNNTAEDFPWNTLRSPIVDVGGGIGSLEIMLFKQPENKNLKFIVFDIPKTIENAHKVWASQSPEHSAQVTLTSGNFMAGSLEESKLPAGCPTYVVRHVLHDWTDEEVLIILRRVRSAMVAKTDDSSIKNEPPQLLLVEMLIRGPTSDAPAGSSRFVRTTSMQLLALSNGIARTEKEMVKLLTEAGFTMQRVVHMRASDSVLIAIPTI